MEDNGAVDVANQPLWEGLVEGPFTDEM
jgi:hypothetical protein